MVNNSTKDTQISLSPGTPPKETPQKDTQNLLKRLLGLGSPDKQEAQKHAPQTAQAFDSKPLPERRGTHLIAGANAILGRKEAHVYSVGANGEPVIEAKAKSSAFGLFKRVSDEPGSDGNPSNGGKSIVERSVAGISVGTIKEKSPDVMLAQETVEEYKVRLSWRSREKAPVGHHEKGEKAASPITSNSAEQAQALKAKYYEEARTKAKLSAKAWNALSPQDKEKKGLEYAIAIRQKDIFEKTIAATGGSTLNNESVKKTPAPMTAEALKDKYYNETRLRLGLSPRDWNKLSPAQREGNAHEYAVRIGQKEIFEKTIAATGGSALSKGNVPTASNGVVSSQTDRALASRQISPERPQDLINHYYRSTGTHYAKDTDVVAKKLAPEERKKFEQALKDRAANLAESPNNAKRVEESSLSPIDLLKQHQKVINHYYKITSTSLKGDTDLVAEKLAPEERKKFEQAIKARDSIKKTLSNN